MIFSDLTISYELMGDEGKYLRWDFVIPTDDDPLFIEYDGRQHFSPQRFGGMAQDQADARFETQQLRDVMKNDYCLVNGYELIRIKYY